MDLIGYISICHPARCPSRLQHQKIHHWPQLPSPRFWLLAVFHNAGRRLDHDGLRRESSGEPAYRSPRSGGRRKRHQETHAAAVRAGPSQYAQF